MDGAVSSLCLAREFLKYIVFWAPTRDLIPEVWPGTAASVIIIFS